MVRSITLNSRETANIIIVFLKPISKYLLVKTFNILAHCIEKLWRHVRKCDKV